MDDTSDIKPALTVLEGGGEKIAKVIAMRRRWSFTCTHHRIEICFEDRVITCASCGAEVDSFAWLSTLMSEWHTWERARENHQKLREDVRELETTERKLKARIRNAKQRLLAMGEKD